MFNLYITVKVLCFSIAMVYVKFTSICYNQTMLP